MSRHRIEARRARRTLLRRMRRLGERLPDVPDEDVPLILDLRLRDQGGLQVVSDRLGVLAGYPWGAPRQAPRGTRARPWSDIDQGWEQQVFQEGEHTWVLEGDGDGTWVTIFRVPTVTWLAVWARRSGG